MENKITERDILNSIKERCADDATIVAYCDKVLAAKAAKAEKAAEKRAEKRTEGDALCDAVYAVLTSDPMIAEDIQVALDMEDVTVPKVRARLVQLEKAGKAVKSDVKVGDKIRKAYSLAD